MVQVGDWVYHVIMWSTSYAVERVRKMAAREVSLQFTPEQVQRWLTSKGIENGYESAVGTDISGRYAYKKGELSAIIKGRIPETDFDFLMAGDTVILFFFDKKGKMVDYRVQQEWTGP